MTQESQMIRLDSVSKRFGQTWIFRAVSLTVADGESVALIGPSGSGKSVLLKIIAGLYPTTEGTVKVSDPNIGMLFQKNALFDSLTVEENLLFPMRERLGLKGAAAQQRARHFLEAVGLAASASLYPNEISGGMQKRLGIARALAVKPRVILYDEPTAGLDPVTSRSIAELIRTLRKEEGATLVTVTNDMQRAYQIGDRICLLARGRLLDGGTPQEVQATENPELRQFIYGLKDGPLTSAIDTEEAVR